MTNHNRVRKILWLETLGFLFLMALSWLDEVARLPRQLFGSGTSGDWHEALLESLALLVVWFLVLTFTKALAQPSGAVKVCMWCRKISDGGNWVPTEDYFGCYLEEAPSQCMCPTCLKRWKHYQQPQDGGLG